MLDGQPKQSQCGLLMELYSSKDFNITKENVLNNLQRRIQQRQSAQRQQGHQPQPWW